MHQLTLVRVGLPFFVHIMVLPVLASDEAIRPFGRWRPDEDHVCLPGHAHWPKITPSIISRPGRRRSHGSLRYQLEN